MLVLIRVKTFCIGYQQKFMFFKKKRPADNSKGMKNDPVSQDLNLVRNKKCNKNLFSST